MKIIEEFCQGKQSEETNEDAIFYNDHFIAVIDGVTAKGTKLYNGRKTGRVARDILLEALPTLKPTMTKEECFTILNKAIREQIEEGSKKEDIPGASILLYSNHYHQLWVCGDCACMVNGIYYDNSKKVDQVVSETRALFIELLKEKGFTEEDLLKKDYSREYINILLRWQNVLDNNYTSPYGYILLNGGNIDFSRIKEIPIQEGDEVVLASDGYPFLKETLEESEAALKQVLKEDPLCYKTFKTMKGLQEGLLSFDDRSYLRFIA